MQPYFFKNMFIYLAALGLSCSVQAAGNMWDLSSQLGIKPMSPALEGGLLTTGPPGKSPDAIL